MIPFSILFSTLKTIDKYKMFHQSENMILEIKIIFFHKFGLPLTSLSDSSYYVYDWFLCIYVYPVLRRTAHAYACDTDLYRILYKTSLSCAGVNLKLRLG